MYFVHTDAQNEQMTVLAQCLTLTDENTRDLASGESLCIFSSVRVTPRTLVDPVPWVKWKGSTQVHSMNHACTCVGIHMQV